MGQRRQAKSEVRPDVGPDRCHASALLSASMASYSPRTLTQSSSADASFLPASARFFETALPFAGSWEKSRGSESARSNFAISVLRTAIWFSAASTLSLSVLSRRRRSACSRRSSSREVLGGGALDLLSPERRNRR